MMGPPRRRSWLQRCHFGFRATSCSCGVRIGFFSILIRMFTNDEFKRRIAWCSCHLRIGDFCRERRIETTLWGLDINMRFVCYNQKLRGAQEENECKSGGDRGTKHSFKTTNELKENVKVPRGGFRVETEGKTNPAHKHGMRTCTPKTPGLPQTTARKHGSLRRQ